MTISPNLREIFEKNNLTEERVSFLFNEIRIISKTETGQLFQKGVSGDDWDILYDISWELWRETDFPIQEKIKLGFEFFELFPLYYQGLVPFYEAMRDKRIVELNHKKEVFDNFAKYLSSEDYFFYYPTEYVLWVEFFEHNDEFIQEANESWSLIYKSEYLNMEGKLRLLRISGPSPVDLKKKLYYELLPEQKYHRKILDALVFSLYDVNGHYDEEIVKDVFSKLRGLNRNSHNYKLLEQRIPYLSQLAPTDDIQTELPEDDINDFKHH